MIPMGSGVSVGDYVARIQEKLADENAIFHLTDMGTLIEGDIQYLLQLIGKIYETPFEQGAVRVVTNIVIDDRRDQEIHIGDKINSVNQRTQKVYK
jgi:uncharacterized protein (TIGR00106 family)